MVVINENNVLWAVTPCGSTSAVTSQKSAHSSYALKMEAATCSSGMLVNIRHHIPEAVIFTPKWFIKYNYTMLSD
jgi:hypothetical protein